ncbi:MAG: VOC family protein [Candidatus Marinimicrobia bacterium]|nr:VOC family protein [Candidatus Neomarinimicrobiota bacterium]
MNEPISKGTHHIGLTVTKLEESATFFTSLLGWKEVRRDDGYPAIFISDGKVMVSLWKNNEEPSIPFNKNRNIGLHNVAFVVEKERDLTHIYEKLVKNEIRIEFPPILVPMLKNMVAYGIGNDL